jgi:hypothetical protein
MCASSEEIPNSISNHTLAQAMLAARRRVEEYGPEHEAGATTFDPSFLELMAGTFGYNFQELMVEMTAFKRLVESGDISGPKADAWKKAMAEEAEVAALRAKAEGGSAAAMRTLAQSYDTGRRGLKKDFTQSFLWFKRAADLKDISSIADCGIAYLTGEGVEQSSTRGLTMIGVAAGMGSEHACQILGRANAEGRHGFDKNPQEATRWYREMQTCKCRDSNEPGRRRADAWLREHPSWHP